ncbi:MAG: FlgD immunoglobulin-like domain containing protein [Candidatus Zixiibacteriota bacterium]
MRLANKPSTLTYSLILVFAFILPVSMAYSADIHWINTGGGNWSTGANWSTGSAPGATDNAYIDATGTYTVVVDGDINVTIINLQGNGILQCQSHTIDVIAIDINSSATLELSNATITGNVYNSGTINIELSCSIAAVYNSEGATVTLNGTSSGSAELTTSGNFINNGMVNLTSEWPPTSTTSRITVDGDSLYNSATGQINGLLGSSFNYNSVRYIDAQLKNYGTITGVSTGIRIWHDDAEHVNTGTMHSQSGKITIGGATNPSDFTNIGTITVDAGTEFGFGTEICTFASGTVNNNGTMSFQCDTIYITPKWTNNGGMAIGLSYLSLTDTLFNAGTFSTTGGSINNSVFVNNDSLLFYNGSVYSDLTNASVIKANISGNIRNGFTSVAGSKIISEATTLNNCNLNFYNTFTNHGTIELTQADQHDSYVKMINSADTLINASDGTIESLAGVGSIAGQRFLDARLHNHGTLNTTSQYLYLQPTSSVGLINTGTINISGGDLRVNDDLTNLGTINVSDTYRYEQLTGNFYISSGGFAGDGMMDFTNDSLFISGTCTNSAELNLTGANVVNTGTLTSSGEITFYDTDVTGAGTINNTGIATMYLSDVACNLQNNGLLTATRLNNITGSFYNGAGDTLIINATSAGNSEFTVGSSWSNYGHISLTSEVANSVTTAILGTTSGVLTNSSSGTISSVCGSSTGGARYINSGISNQGTILADNLKLEIASNAGSSNSNSGTLHLSGAAIDWDLGAGSTLSNSGDIVFENLQTLTIENGTITNTIVGEIAGNGSLNTYATTFVNNGYINPGTSPGRLNFQANWFPMSSIDAQMNIEIGGLTATTEHDQVYCTNTAQLGGVLNLTLIDDYYPAVDDSFKVLVYSTRDGNFDAILGLSQTGYTFDTNFVSDGLWIVTSALDNTAPVITGMPATYSFYADSTGLLGIWNYISDDYTSDTNHTYIFTVDNDSLNYNLNVAGFLELTAETGFTGEVILGMSVTDEHGATSYDTTVVTVLAGNHAPVVNLADTLTFDNSISLGYNIWSSITDAESHDTLLTYQFSISNDSLVYAYNESNGLLILSDSGGYVGTAMLYVTVTDPEGAEGADTITVIVTGVQNTVPVVNLADTLTFQTGSFRGVSIWDAVTDAESHDSLLTYNITVSNDSLIHSYTASTGGLFLSASGGFVGTVMLYVHVTDPQGAQAADTATVVVTAIPNDPPVIDLPDSLSFSIAESPTIDIWSMVSDEDHDTLLYYAFSTSNDSLVQSYNTETGVLTLSSSNGWIGNGIVRLTVTDTDTALAHDSIFVTVTLSLDVDDDDAILPSQFALKQNYPNPFNPLTIIEYDLPRNSYTSLTVYNILGQEIKRLVDQNQPAGSYGIVWDGTDSNGKRVASGVYFYQLIGDNYSQTNRMVLLK